MRKLELHLGRKLVWLVCNLHTVKPSSKHCCALRIRRRGLRGWPSGERGDPDTQLRDSSVRNRRTPDINCDTSSIGDLISWSEGVSEPPLTCFLSTSEVKNFINTPMEVLNWPCHTQSIESVVKMVTGASAKYFSQEKRDGGIRAQETSRRLMSKNESKQDLCNRQSSRSQEIDLCNCIQ
ncbi:hypothetical protein AAFF_G00409480 [Aldrovandia affinis]|uniref:Uncharacterized protein n=1 Tax=Aldrovandia affinis TaxID=143900 RepID=A0AAD7WJS9_9TELE|nr:hypothetical protein AAFF_G00409480 [Aldrovandia affinis]